MKFCPECGAKLAGDAPKFCGECGYKLAIVGAMPTDRPNSELSDEELRAKADAGDAEAIKDVGLRFERAGDNEMARQWYERAAGMGHGGAMRNLGVLRKDVDDHEGALAWFIRAADSGSDLTMDRGSITVSRPVTVSARAASQAALELFKMNRLDEAEQWIKRSQDMDDDQAVVVIAGHLYEEDFTSVRALEWCKRASDEGDVRGTIFVIAILSQTERYIEMAPYLERTLETNPEFTEVTQESFALFARMAGLQFGVEGDFPASRSWLERSEQLGDPEAAGYLATLAKDINEFDARSEVNEAEDPWTRPAHMGGVEHASESALSEAQDPLTDPSRLEALASSADVVVRNGVGGNRSSPVELLTRLADDPHPHLRTGVAGNLSTPVEVLTRLAGDPDRSVRRAVAGNPHTPVEVLTRLADDADDRESWVREGVAVNLSTPVEVLTRLAGDPDTSVRRAVAGNPSASEEVMKRVHTIESGLTEAEDPATDPARLAELATGAEEFVRRRALLNPACPNEVRDASGLVFMFVLQRAYFKGGLCDLLVTKTDVTTDLASAWVEVLYSSGGAEDYEVARAAQLPWETHNRATNDIQYLVWCGNGAPDWWSDWSLIKDFLGSDAVAALARGDETLFEDNTWKAADHRVAFAGHEATSVAWDQVRQDLRTVFDSRDNAEVRTEATEPPRRSSSKELAEVWERWLRGDSWREVSEIAHRAVVSALARHPNTPRAVLEELAVSDREWVRWLVTRNPSATDEMRAAAVLIGVEDEKFIEELPDEDFSDISFDGVHLAVHASVWTREGFADEFAETLDDFHRGVVTHDGQVAIDSRFTELPEQIFDYLNDLLGRAPENTYGSVTEFEMR